MIINAYYVTSTLAAPRPLILIFGLISWHLNIRASITSLLGRELKCM